MAASGQKIEKASGRSPQERARVTAIAVLTAAAAVFAVLNLDEVKVQVLVASARLPLVVVIVGCLLIGFAVGHFTGRRRSKA